MEKETSITNSFIELAKKIREGKKLTIEQLADLAGVHRTTIGLLERNERSPTLQVASQIASALQIPLSELIQEAELVGRGKINAQQLAEFHQNRTPNREFLRNEDKLIETIGVDGSTLLGAIDACYQTLDTIDEQLIGKGSLPIAHLVELANLSSMVGNMVGGGIADYSNGLYARNKPHTYPDLLPQSEPAVNLELKMALETNKPKGHLPKAGTYITFRYILGDKQGNFNRGKENRGDTVWIWEVKVGHLTEEDFSCSNTEGDSGKTAVIKTDVFNKMHLVYYISRHLPYAHKADGKYVGFN
ncbi:helix-turn-helix transcriptional regulator [uncultured Shewanella sp.]|uniref:helix-turn-helix domain-containing protein n=1 Tax=uncultured Shewanella sp. TaxID=173975 RepID=UPI002604B789|nr:helix-turn-helix transcriptional regulator [uncultured Shewanella sp.]